MSRDTSFYYSFLVLTPERRRGIIGVWDFCRAVDDAVDESAEGRGPLTGDERQQALSALERWRQELALAFGGGTPTTTQGESLAQCVREFALPRQPFEDLIDGVAMDIDHHRYETSEALEEYCWRVASTVGLICLPIFGARDPGAQEYARQLGLALQLTNIVRDVGVDLARGRVYLPQADMARFGVTEDALARGVATPAIRALLAHQCARARSHYARAAAALPPSDRRRLVAARIMGGIYFALLRRIERSGYDVFSQTIRVPRPRRALIAASLWAGSLVGLR